MAQERPRGPRTPRRPGGAGIDDLEDAYMGAAVLERVRSGKEQTYSLDTVMEELDLDASDL